jgi:hypothetical protein
MKHTPGPWRAAWSLAGYWLVYIGDRMLSLQGAESKADACLIAGAPELLEACESMISAAMFGDEDEMDAAVRAAHEAVAKATGSNHD